MEENNIKKEETENITDDSVNEPVNTSNNASISDIDKVKAERDEYLNSWKRCKADLINYKKEEAERVEEIAKFGSRSLIKEIIGVIGNFNLAIDSLEKSGKMDEGLNMIKSQMEDILKRNGVEKINAEVGSQFNPMYHEAIGMVEEGDKLKSGEIAEELEVGYMMHDKVIQVAKVRVVN